ncbi:hypothetical protein GGF37_002433, partial [Kickxella alabastrina]
TLESIHFESIAFKTEFVLPKSTAPPTDFVYFSNLKSLHVYGGYPFSDNVLFRSEGGYITFESLEIIVKVAFIETEDRLRFFTAN